MIEANSALYHLKHKILSRAIIIIECLPFIYLAAFTVFWSTRMKFFCLYNFQIPSSIIVVETQSKIVESLSVVSI